MWVGLDDTSCFVCHGDGGLDFNYNIKIKIKIRRAKLTMVKGKKLTKLG